MAKPNPPEQKLPKRGGSYVREGGKVTRVAHTAPSPVATATEPPKPFSVPTPAAAPSPAPAASKE